MKRILIGMALSAVVFGRTLSAGPLEDATAALGAKDTAKAIALYSAWLKEHATADDQKLVVLESLVQAHAMQGTLHVAFSVVEKEVEAAASAPQPYLARLNFMLGQLNSAMGRTLEAISSFKYVKERAASAAYAKDLDVILAELYIMRRGDVEHGAPYLESFISKNPTDPRTDTLTRFLVVLRINSSRPEDRVKGLDLCLQYAPKAASRAMALDMLDSVRAHGAITDPMDKASLLAAYLKLGGDVAQPERWFELAQLYASRAGQQAQAVEAYQKAIALRPEAYWIFTAAEYMSNQKKYRKNAVALVKGHFDQLKGNALRQAYDFLIARVADQMFTSMADDDQAWDATGRTSALQEREALVLKKMQALGESAEDFYTLAMVRELAGNKDAAAEAYQKSFTLDPDFANGEIPEKIIRLYGKEGAAKALAAVSAMMQKAPAWAVMRSSGWLLVGNMAMDAGKKDEAFAAYREALKGNAVDCRQVLARLSSTASVDGFLPVLDDIVALTGRFPADQEIKRLTEAALEVVNKSGNKEALDRFLANKGKAPVDAFSVAYDAYVKAGAFNKPAPVKEALDVLMKDFGDRIPRAWSGFNRLMATPAKQHNAKLALYETLWADASFRTLPIAYDYFHALSSNAGYFGERKSSVCVSIAADLIPMMSKDAGQFTFLRNAGAFDNLIKQIRNHYDGLRKNEDFVALFQAHLEKAVRAFGGADEQTTVLREMVSASFRLNAGKDWVAVSKLLAAFPHHDSADFQNALYAALDSATPDAPEDIYQFATQLLPEAQKGGWGDALTMHMVKDRTQRKKNVEVLPLLKAAFEADKAAKRVETAQMGYEVLLYTDSRDAAAYQAASKAIVEAALSGMAPWAPWGHTGTVGAARAVLRPLALAETVSADAMLTKSVDAFPTGPAHFYACLAQSKCLVVNPTAALEGRILLQKALYSRLDAGERTFGAPAWNDILGMANQYFQTEDFPNALWIARSLNDAFKGNNDLVKQMINDCEARLGEGIEEYENPILELNKLVMHNEKEKAIALYIKTQSARDEYFDKLSPEALHLIARFHARSGGTEGGVIADSIALKFLSQRKTATAEERAEMQFILGEASYERREYERALLEYRSCVEQYPGTAAAQQASFRVGETLLEQNRPDKAKEHFESLMEGLTTPEAIAQVQYYIAKVHVYEDQLDTALDLLKDVLDTDGTNRQAKLLMIDIYRRQSKWMVVIQMLKQLGDPVKENKLEPGNPLDITVNDSGYRISRGMARIPVQLHVMRPVLENGKPKLDDQKQPVLSLVDNIKVDLMKDVTNDKLFSKSVQTTLGDANPNDQILQVKGGDVIYYFFDPSVGGENPDIHSVELASDAKFFVSSGEILSEEERADRARNQLNSMLSQQTPATAIDRIRNNSNIRPGGPVYVKVIDRDRDLTIGKDSVRVKVKASSGDEEVVELSEADGDDGLNSGVNSGQFLGMLRTGLKPADCQASSVAVGADPSAIISPNPQTVWKPLPPEKGESVWLQVDMKKIEPVSKVHLSAFINGLPKIPGGVMSRFSILSSIDGRNFDPIATYPVTQMTVPGVMEFAAYRGAMGDALDSCRLAASGDPMMSANFEKKANQWEAPMRMLRAPFAIPSGAGLGVLRGNFVVDETGMYGFESAHSKFMIFAIDGEVILNAENVRNQFPLEQGLHKLECYWPLKSSGSIVVAMESLSSKKIESGMNASWFDPEKHPEVRDQTIGVPTILAQDELDFDGKRIPHSFVIEFPQPKRTRILRLQINDYVGEVPRLGQFQVHDALGTQIIPSGIDVTKLKGNDVLEMTPGDTVSCSYLDELNINHDGVPYELSGELSVTYYNGSIRAVHREFSTDSAGNRKEALFPLQRFKAGDAIVVSVQECDADLTPKRDKIEATVRSRVTGKEIRYDLTESADHSGVFEGTFWTVANEADAKAGRPTLLTGTGDAVTLTYTDRENTNPGVSFDRTATIFEAIGSDVKIRILESRVKQNEDGSTSVSVMGGNPDWEPLDHPAWIVPDAPLTVQAKAPGMALHGGCTLPVIVTASSGHKVALVLGINQAGLPEGVFSGSLHLNLSKPDGPTEMVVTKAAKPTNYSFDLDDRKSSSSKNSSKLSRRTTTAAPKSGPKNMIDDLAVEKVLNVCGADSITVTYDPTFGSKKKKTSPEAPTSEEGARSPDSISTMAVIRTDASLGFMDSGYEEKMEIGFVGENLYLYLRDADADVSQEPDSITVTFKSEAAADSLDVTMTETFPHSGDFRTRIRTQYVGRTNGKLSTPALPEILEVDFGDKVTAIYHDISNCESDKPIDRSQEVALRKGDTGRLDIFGRHFGDDTFAAKTQFNLAEAYFMLGSQLKELDQMEAYDQNIQKGRQVLEEALKDYPDTDYAAQAQFLLADLEFEAENYDAAINGYQLVLKGWPGSEYSPRAQFRIGLAYEEKGSFTQAVEEYVKVAYGWPDHYLVGNVIIRIGTYFWTEANKADPNRSEDKTQRLYVNAAQVFRRLPERFPEHELAEKAFFQVAQCYMRAKMFKNSAEVIEEHLVKWPDSEMKPELLYWAGRSYKEAGAVEDAYKKFVECRLHFPESEAASWARAELIKRDFDSVAQKYSE